MKMKMNCHLLTTALLTKGRGKKINKKPMLVTQDGLKEWQRYLKIFLLSPIARKLSDTTFAAKSSKHDESEDCAIILGGSGKH